MSDRKETTEAECIVRATWAAYGGQGDPPPLIVSRGQYEAFLKAGLPAHMMQIAEKLPP